MTQPISLDFDALVRAYLENLNVQLRGFHPAEQHPFLVAWVPSDDPTECLGSLVELARDEGVTSLSITLDRATSDQIRHAELSERFGPFLPHEVDGRVEYVFQAPKDSSLEIHACYRARLKQVLAEVIHERSLTDSPGHEFVEVEEAGVSLSALIDARHQVTWAAFHGATNPVTRGIFEALCRVMDRKPIQECSDHAMIAVESNLRDAQESRPVAGLVTPENADPAFALPQRLVRRLLAEYRRRTEWAETANFYDVPPSQSWVRAGSENRRERLEKALNEVGADVAELIGLEGLKRVVVRFTAELSSDQKQDWLRKFEDHLRAWVETTLHVTAQTKADTNILRQPDKIKLPVIG